MVSRRVFELAKEEARQGSQEIQQSRGKQLPREAMLKCKSIKLLFVLGPPRRVGDMLRSKLAEEGAMMCGFSKRPELNMRKAFLIMTKVCWPATPPAEDSTVISPFQY